jgi:hypothetical protein
LARMRRYRAERLTTRRSQQLEARQLQLDGHACMCNCIDQRAAVRLYCCRCAVCRREPRLQIRAAGGPQAGGIGVEAQHQLRLALLHPRSKNVAKAGRLCQRPFTALFNPLPAVKRGTRDAAI